MPLTADRAKPAVPFGGQYRLIDFAMSNLINSGLRQIVVLTQYKSHSLDRHVSQTWRMSALLDSYVASVPAQQRLGKRWFSGSADAILQSLNLINDEKPDIVVVVGADHVYRMDFSQMIDAHIESGAARRRSPRIRQPISLANQFGVIEVDDEGPDAHPPRSSRSRRTRWASPTRPREVLASMGNYVFDADALIEAVHARRRAPDSNHDMGGDIIPDFVGRGEAGVYDLKRNDVPGSTDRDRYYWRDVGTIDSFFEAHQDLISTLPDLQPLQPRVADLQPAAQLAAGEVRARRARNASATRSTRSSRSARSSRARTSSAACSVRGRSSASGATSPTRSSSTACASTPARRVQRAILDKDVVVEDGATRRRRPRERPARAASPSPTPASPSSARASPASRANA